METKNKSLLLRSVVVAILIQAIGVCAYGQRRGHQQEEQWECPPPVITDDMGRNFTPKNGTLDEFSGQMLAVFEVQSKNSEIANIALALKKKAVEDIAKLMAKYEKKAKEWAATAQREGVKDFDKPFYSKLKPGLVDITLLGYVKGGNSYGRSYTNSLTTRNYLQIGYPTFLVDADGQCFITLAANVGILKEASSKSIQSSTTINGGGILSPNLTVGHTTSREVEDNNLGWVHIYVSIAELDAFIEHLNQLVRDFSKTKDNKKATDALFK